MLDKPFARILFSRALPTRSSRLLSSSSSWLHAKPINHRSHFSATPLMEKTQEFWKDRHLYIAFIDLKAAFDSVYRRSGLRSSSRYLQLCHRSRDASGLRAKSSSVFWQLPPCCPLITPIIPPCSPITYETSYCSPHNKWSRITQAAGSALQWFPNYAPRHTAAPPDVIRCAAKNIEIKINQVEFLKFHPANFCQYNTLSILMVVMRYATQRYDNRAIAYVATSGYKT